MLTPSEILRLRQDALAMLDTDPSSAFAMLCEATTLEAELRATGQRTLPINAPQLPLRCPLLPSWLAPAINPAWFKATHRMETPMDDITPAPLSKWKTFDPQLKLF